VTVTVKHEPDRTTPKPTWSLGDENSPIAINIASFHSRRDRDERYKFLFFADQVLDAVVKLFRRNRIDVSEKDIEDFRYCFKGLADQIAPKSADTHLPFYQDQNLKPGKIVEINGFSGCGDGSLGKIVESSDETYTVRLDKNQEVHNIPGTCVKLASADKEVVKKARTSVDSDSDKTEEDLSEVVTSSDSGDEGDTRTDIGPGEETIPESDSSQRGESGKDPLTKQSVKPAASDSPTESKPAKEKQVATNEKDVVAVTVTKPAKAPDLSQVREEMPATPPASQLAPETQQTSPPPKEASISPSANQLAPLKSSSADETEPASKTVEGPAEADSAVSTKGSEEIPRPADVKPSVVEPSNPPEEASSSSTPSLKEPGSGTKPPEIPPPSLSVEPLSVVASTESGKDEDSPKEPLPPPPQGDVVVEEPAKSKKSKKNKKPLSELEFEPTDTNFQLAPIDNPFKLQDKQVNNFFEKPELGFALRKISESSEPGMSLFDYWPSQDVQWAYLNNVPNPTEVLDNNPSLREDFERSMLLIQKFCLKLGWSCFVLDFRQATFGVWFYRLSRADIEAAKYRDETTHSQEDEDKGIWEPVNRTQLFIRKKTRGNDDADSELEARTSAQ